MFAPPPGSLSARSPSPRLTPIASLHRGAYPNTARPTTTSAALRGGGRLYAQSPLNGYTEAEMIREAQLRTKRDCD